MHALIYFKSQIFHSGYRDQQVLRRLGLFHTKLLTSGKITILKLVFLLISGKPLNIIFVKTLLTVFWFSTKNKGRSVYSYK